MTCGPWAIWNLKSTGNGKYEGVRNWHGVFIPSVVGAASGIIMTGQDVKQRSEFVVGLRMLDCRGAVGNSGCQFSLVINK